MPTVDQYLRAVARSQPGTPLLLKLAPMMLADSASVMTTLVAVTTPVLLKATPYSSNHRC